MALLQDILYKSGIRSVTGRTDIEVKDVQIDSRKVATGSLFIAIKGVMVDGHQFIDKVVTAGAVAVVVESMPAILKEGITYVQVDDSSIAA